MSILILPTTQILAMLFPPLGSSLTEGTPKCPADKRFGNILGFRGHSFSFCSSSCSSRYRNLRTRGTALSFVPPNPFAFPSGVCGYLRCFHCNKLISTDDFLSTGRSIVCVVYYLYS